LTVHRSLRHACAGTSNLKDEMDVQPEPLIRKADQLRVIVVDDDAFARRVVRDALGEHDDIVVTAEAGGGREAIELALHYKPSVVVMDIVMPDVDGITATREITARLPDTQVVVLTSSAEDELSLLALRAGASGVLCKCAGTDALPRVVKAVHAGEAAVSRRLTMRLVESIRRLPDDGTGMRPVHSALTRREWEVLDLLCQSRSTDQIAETLFVSPDTVRSHVKSILRKFGVRSRRDAVAAAAKLRMGIEPDGAAP
jgi:DNA-binding NarL/FixJ family response regulator